MLKGEEMESLELLLPIILANILGMTQLILIGWLRSCVYLFANLCDQVDELAKLVPSALRAIAPGRVSSI